MKKLKIFGETVFFEEEDLQLENLNEITPEDARAILFLSKKLLDDVKIDFYLAYGTLLGAIRDQNFIKGDLDVDIIVKDEVKLVKNLNDFQKKGLKLVRTIPHVLYSFRLNNRCYIDFYIWGKPTFGIWRLYCDRIALRYVPRKLLAGESSIMFLGSEFKTIADPISLLKFWYGDSWCIPIGKFEKKYHYEVKSHYYFRAFFEPWVRLCRKIFGENVYENIKSIIIKCMAS